jgi:Fic family protein
MPSALQQDQHLMDVYPLIEIAVRFHHKLVQIHPFPNGNGRMGRLAADLLLEYSKVPPLNWGRASLVAETEIRDTYLEALREADQNRYAKLLAFASSGSPQS